jgi:hypothetical protein
MKQAIMNFKMHVFQFDLKNNNAMKLHKHLFDALTPQ